MASSAAVRTISVDRLSHKESSNKVFQTPFPLLPPAQLVSMAREMISPQKELLEDPIQPELISQPDGQPIDLVEGRATNVKGTPVSKDPQAKDEDLSETPTLFDSNSRSPGPKSPKYKGLRGEISDVAHLQAEKSPSENSTFRTSHHNHPNLQVAQADSLSLDNAKQMNRKHKALEDKVIKPRNLNSASSPPPRNNVDEAMESLISQLDKILKIEDKATTASKMVEVPSGYKLDLEVGPEEFYKIQEECKLLDKRKRAAGLLPMSTKRYQRYGYRPEELLATGALYSPNARQSNLTNEVHPFFHRRRFDDTPDTIYNQLVPGLRLATMFLTQPICCGYWVTLAKGQRKHDVTMSKELGRRCLRIAQNVPLSIENATEVIEYIKKLDDASIIHFSFRKDLYLNKPRDVLARTRPVCDVDFEIPEGLAFRPKRSHVCLHHDFYTAAHKLSKLIHPDPALILRFNFFLACNILHEMAHAINVAHCYSQQAGGLSAGIDYNEPFLFDDDEAELGNAWEKQTFGGRIAPINGRVDTSHGLSICDWPYVGLPKDIPPIVGLPPCFRRGSLFSTAMDDKQHVFRSIPMDFVEQIQQMSLWEQEFDLTTDTDIFHIERTGAVSISMNRFTTMPWSEELRIVVEQLARPFARSADDDEEPPTKKRETGRGKAVRTDIFGRTVVPREEAAEEDVKGLKQIDSAAKGSVLQGAKTKHRGRQNRHLKMLRMRNEERRRKQMDVERKNAGPH